ncbi:MAG: hypothetical protein ACI35S_04915 [Anaeroplasma sp.]
MNIGGYTESDFNESDCVSILKMKLDEKRTIFSHFTEQDKIPNTDGFFEILSKSETKRIPKARFEVQIKSLYKNYINGNIKYNRSAYKYSCETKILNAVLQGIFLNPAILFMVDVENKKIFYKHVTFQYALSLDVDEKENKVIYFNDDDELNDIDKFYQECKEIYSDKLKVLQSAEENKFVISPNLTQIELNILQEEFDYLNNIFDTDLKFVKKQLFQNLWKFGIAFVKNEQFISVGIYQIKYGKKEAFFGLLDKQLFRRCNFVSFNKSEKSIHDIINDFIGKILIDSYDKIIIPFETFSIDILNEIAFMFLDKIS